MVRRLKEDIRQVQGGFPQRNVKPIRIDGLPETAPELVLSRLLDEYRTAPKTHAGASRRAQAAAGLLVVGLQQRLLSSIEAFARSLKVHRQTVERHWRKSHEEATESRPQPAQDELFTRPADANDDRAEWTDEELEAEEAAQTEHLTSTAEDESDPDAALWEHEQELLDRMESVADEHRQVPDAKADRLIDWIRENQCPGLPLYGLKVTGAPPRWNNRRVLIFTENRQGTKFYLKNILDNAIESSDRADERIEVTMG